VALYTPCRSTGDGTRVVPDISIRFSYMGRFMSRKNSGGPRILSQLLTRTAAIASEMLERRMLLSATLSGTTLSVTGTSGGRYLHAKRQRHFKSPLLQGTSTFTFADSAVNKIVFNPSGAATHQPAINHQTHHHYRRWTGYRKHRRRIGAAARGDGEGGVFAVDSGSSRSDFGCRSTSSLRSALLRVW